MFGIAPTVAAAYTLVLHAALWLPITALGLYYMVVESLTWRDFGQAVASGQLAKEVNVPPVDPAQPRPNLEKSLPESDTDSSLADSPAH